MNPVHTGPQQAVQETRGYWQAYHIYYSASPRPLLLQLVEPLVDELTDEGLLAGHFFINYWLEGPHVRLRLRPSSPEAARPVRERTEAAVAAFLRRRPALYEVPPGFLDDYYDKLMEREFTPAQRTRLLGPDGTMRLRATNTFSAEHYQPEYGKYGGPAGVELAEWHFEHSSRLVLDANRTLNLHLRPVALGFAAQVMTVTAGCLVRDGELLAEFLDGYHRFWDESSGKAETAGQDDFDRGYRATADSLGPRIRRILAAVGADDFSALPGTLRAWAEHCRELRRRVVDLTEQGRVAFAPPEQDEEPWPDARPGVTDLAVTLPRLLVPYLHMTNNRLSMTLQDEAYLAYVLARALTEPGVRPAADEPATAAS
ncbi:lantibiotic dehydratase C-terminal domain-containing protein [Streptacidiphilus melanogenes]|uniref:lantibiotic dehydratase C-terminal domain-containing protein n=1 Tax=Streptacidiphilus melanogenes TaxID=411235 RepID=UPI0005AAE2C9|nr:lantibiotic dehydratase C-terminal domain-containing protein [Streptacidiphilus melanogenes]